VKEWLAVGYHLITLVEFQSNIKVCCEIKMINSDLLENTFQRFAVEAQVSHFQGFWQALVVCLSQIFNLHKMNAEAPLALQKYLILPLKC